MLHPSWPSARTRRATSTARERRRPSTSTTSPDRWRRRLRPGEPCQTLGGPAPPSAASALTVQLKPVRHCKSSCEHVVCFLQFTLCQGMTGGRVFQVCSPPAGTSSDPPNPSHGEPTLTDGLVQSNATLPRLCRICLSPPPPPPPPSPRPPPPCPLSCRQPPPPLARPLMGRSNA